ncbi:hypothetical protein EVAR_68597_1 [Eumeta japonica]|uniref:Uncharacterized protein n=1 Tax=Eumeta variegata TaxID=151549 RepID=A0A4C1ZPL8_EUMVA|nr:hypothetical protein EVAR_68597_1 [Eumeta japonica]
MFGHGDIHFSRCKALAPPTRRYRGALFLQDLSSQSVLLAGETHAPERRNGVREGDKDREEGRRIRHGQSRSEHQRENKLCRPVEHHTLVEYRREVTASTVALPPISERLPSITSVFLHRPTIPPSDIISCQGTGNAPVTPRDCPRSSVSTHSLTACVLIFPSKILQKKTIDRKNC